MPNDNPRQEPTDGLAPDDEATIAAQTAEASDTDAEQVTDLVGHVEFDDVAEVEAGGQRDRDVTMSAIDGEAGPDGETLNVADADVLDPDMGSDTIDDDVEPEEGVSLADLADPVADDEDGDADDAADDGEDIDAILDEDDDPRENPEAVVTATSAKGATKKKKKRNTKATDAATSDASKSGASKTATKSTSTKATAAKSGGAKSGGAGSTSKPDAAKREATMTKAERKAAERARIERSKELAAKARGKGGRRDAKADPSTMTREQLRYSEPKAQQLDDVNPVWFKPIMFGFLLIGFLWIIVYYLSSARLPIAELGDWNLLVGIGIALVGFLMMTNWK